MRFEGFFASFSPSLDPVAHRSLTYSQCHGYIFLLPAFLFQFPRAFSSFFSPIGFLWCSHSSYRITLDFLPPMSVDSPQPKNNPHKLLYLTISSMGRLAFWLYNGDIATYMIMNSTAGRGVNSK